MGIDDGLRISGRTGSEQKFGDAVRRHLCMRGGDACASSRAKQIGEQCGPAIAQWIARDDQFDLVRHGFVNRARERPAIIGKHQPGREQIDDRAQLSEVARH